MADNVQSEIQGQKMPSIMGDDTKHELVLRHGLHNLGFRYRLNDRRLPGEPEMVFPRYQAVIFAHSCFWHGHSCHLSKCASTNEEYWENKIISNREDNKVSISNLLEIGWRVGVVWECSLKGKYRINSEEVIGLCAQWLETDMPSIEIGGQC